MNAHQTDRQPLRSITTACITLLIVALLPATLTAQPRESLTINEAGQVLHYTGVDDEPIASLSTNGVDTVLLGEGSPVTGTGGGTVDGFGALGDVNDSGVVALQITFDDDSGTDPFESDGALATFSGGTSTTIAVARHDGSGTAFGSDSLCAISPMPLTNLAGQVVYHGVLDIGGDGDLNQACGNNSFNSGAGTAVGGEQTVLLRYSPGPGNQVLIRGDYAGGADTLTTTAASGYLSGPTTFDITEVEFINIGERKLNSSGQVLTGVMLDADTSDDEASPSACDGSGLSADCALRDDRNAFVIADGTTVTPIAVAGPPGESLYQGFDGWAGISEFQGNINDSGQVLFKSFSGTDVPPSGDRMDCGTRRSECELGEYQINLYSPGVGVNTLVSSGDPVPTPGSDAIFCDFAPHFSLNNAGNIAFLASLAMDGQCDFQIGSANNLIDGSGDWEALFYYSGGELTEIARNVEAANNDPGGGTFITEFNGLSFDQIGSAAVLPNSGVVYFYGEDNDGHEMFPGCNGGDLEPGNDDDGGNDVELTELYSWIPGVGIASVLREGDLLTNGDRILRIATDGPKLRRQANSRGELVAYLETDSAASGDCVYVPDDGDEAVIVTGISDLPRGPVLEIPVATPGALGVLALLLAASAVLWMRRYA